MAAFKQVTSPAVLLPVNDIDTDQIIPARFLTTTTKVGLGEKLFNDWRVDPAFAINQPAARNASILIAGHNFGCGSSREHAPWALLDFGFRVVIATSFADIFTNNALKNGLLPVTVAADVHVKLLEQAKSGASITVDLERSVVVLPSGDVVPFVVDAFARRCLLDGVDELGYILGFEKRIAAYEGRHP
jgi:3-isopropylmalate/(R)-2-methylmalate dehydratase small subunit